MISPIEVEQLLVAELGWTDVSGVEEIGAGAWSTAFGFSSGDEHLVIRVGAQVVDFQRDARMAQYASRHLPIPRVFHVGELGREPGTYCCVSERVFGVPLEMCSVADWPSVASNLADVLAAMRQIEPPSDAKPAPWHQQLLSIERGDYDVRMAGWRDRLNESAAGAAAYAAVLHKLERIDLGEVPLTLIHGDLINRNVHVDGAEITGVFDWGCQRWGDHLFELAWFEFWEPWNDNLDVEVLRNELDRRWSSSGLVSDRAQERRWANLAQIGLDHLAYNAWADKPIELLGVIERMEILNIL